MRLEPKIDIHEVYSLSCILILEECFFVSCITYVCRLCSGVGPDDMPFHHALFTSPECLVNLCEDITDVLKSGIEEHSFNSVVEFGDLRRGLKQLICDFLQVRYSIFLKIVYTVTHRGSLLCWFFSVNQNLITKGYPFSIPIFLHVLGHV